MESQKLSSMSICFTGGIERINPDTGKPFKRELMWKLVENNGGKGNKSITKNTTHLVQINPDSLRNSELEIDD